MAGLTVAVGGEVDSWCTRCKRDLNHTVVAHLNGNIRRVQCLTCAGQHNYKAAGATALAAAEKKRNPRPKPAARKQSWRTPAAAVVEDENAAARDYRLTDIFNAGEYIQHPTYGRGKVMLGRGNKIDVQFTTGVRTLLRALKT